MKHRIFSIVLVLCLCISSQSVAYACQEGTSLQEDVLPFEESTSRVVTRDSVIPTPTEVYEAMIALKNQEGYQEGTTWTDYEPYSDTLGNYHWNGGPLNGVNIVAAGCVAFAFVLSDAAFGSLQARMYPAGEFSFENIKVGDILRVNNDTHTVIVLEVSDGGVIIAEGNYSGTVHWGRAISKADVMNNTSHYITRYPEGYIPPDDPTANDIIETGTLGEGLTWNLTKAGTITISGNGAMPDFSSNADQPWNSYSSQIRKVVIENGITGIGSCAFWGCGILSAEIPASVTTIGSNAFRNSSIISLTIPSSVKTIGDSAFRECQNLCSMTVSEGVETIGQNAFRSCTSLTSIDLPASIEEIGAAAFFQCQAMKNATFTAGSKQVKLGDNMFTECYYLMNVTLPKSINCIGEGMFQNCHMLAQVEIPQGAESIGASAFASCSSLTSVIIPDSVATMGIAAFSVCPLTDVYFTGTEAQWDSISKIGDTATAVSKATIHYNYRPTASPDPGTGDDDENPGNGENPGSSEKPVSSQSPGSSENPISSEKPGDSDNPVSSEKPVSSQSPGSSENPVSSEKPGGSQNPGSSQKPGSSNNPGSSKSPGNSKSQVPGQTTFAKGKTFTVSKVTYKVTKVGEEVELIASKSTAAKVMINTVLGTDGVKYKVTSIGSKAMQNNKKVTSLTIGANVKTIGANAFSGCTKLTKVMIGKTSKSCLTTIGKNAFNGCKKLSRVTIRSTKLSSIGKQVLKGTKSSLKVKVPSKQLAKYKKILKKAGLNIRQVTK